MPRTAPLAALAALALALTACGDDAAAPDSAAAVDSGDPAACPGEVVDVVVSVGQWGDVVRRLGGDCATVTTVVASGSVDPHDFEPVSADLAAFDRADLVVVNGGHYDEWAHDAAHDAPALVEATAVGSDDSGAPDAGGHDHAGEEGHAEEEGHADEGHAEEEGHEHGAEGDPHVWYDPAVVVQVADAVTRQLTELSPDAAPYFDAQRAAFAADLQPLLDTVAALRATAEGRTYAATETVFDPMAEAIGLTDVTPEGYRRSTSNESDPAPGDLAAFETALRDGDVDVLVFNSQTSGGVTEQLREVAEDADVPVVEVTESSPDEDGSFVEWQLDQLQALSDALGTTP